MDTRPMTRCGKILWTEKEEQYIRDHIATDTMEEVAEALGRTKRAIAIRCSELGIASRSYVVVHWTPAMDGTIRRWWKIKKSAEIAQLIGVTSVDVNRRAKALNLKSR